MYLTFQKHDFMLVYEALACEDKVTHTHAHEEKSHRHPQHLHSSVTRARLKIVTRVFKSQTKERQVKNT